MKIYANNKNVTVNLSDYAPKEELENYQSKTDETLPTEDKTISGAIKELFQNANNGKQLIANAIGEPVSAEDTFSAMSNDINGLLATFKTNMMNNGITVESGDRFKSLIDKIATLANNEGKGIQYASGNVSDFSVSDEYYKGVTTVINTNTTFTPNIIIFTCDNISDPSYLGTVNNVSISSTVANSTSNMAVFRGTTGNSVSMYISDITATSFSLITLGTISFSNMNWYAIRVGEEDTTLRDSLASILQDEGVDVTEEDDIASLIDKIKELIEGKRNKGIQYAEGTVPDFRLNFGNGTYNETVVTNLDFEPTAIFVIFDKYAINGSISTNLGISNFNENVTHEDEMIYIDNISSSSFDIVSDYEYYSTSYMEGIKWYAIGVGEENTTLRDALADILENKGVNVTDDDDMASLITKVNDINTVVRTTYKTTSVIGSISDSSPFSLEIPFAVGFTPSEIQVCIPELQIKVGAGNTLNLVNTMVSSLYKTEISNLFDDPGIWIEIGENSFTLNGRFYIDSGVTLKITIID